MDSFEESVRRALHATSYPTEHVDADDFLAGVHRRARGRRTRRVAGSVAATVAVVTAGGYVGMASGIFTEPSTPIAGQSTVVGSPDADVPEGLSGTSEPEDGSGGALPSALLSAPTAESTVDPPTQGTVVQPTEETVPPTDDTVTPTEETVPPTDDTVTATQAPPTATEVPEAAKALSLSATGTQHQWVLLAVPYRDCPEQRCAVVEMTDNAGKSWEPLSAIDIPVSSQPDTDTVREVRFAGDGANGWAFGGDLLSTHDAGASWTTPTLPVPGIVTSLEAWGDSVYAVVDDEQGNVALVRSPVGYDDWQQLDLGTDPYSISSLVVSERVVALLARPMNSDVGNLVLVSTDGISWESHQPCTDGRYPSTLSTTGNSLWTMCTDDVTSMARVSLDDGRTWIDAAGEFPPGSELAARDDTSAVVADPAGDSITLIGVDRAPVEVTDADLTDVDLAGFTNPTTGYVLDADGQVLRTDDGGRTWQPYSLPR